MSAPPHPGDGQSDRRAARTALVPAVVLGLVLALVLSLAAAAVALLERHDARRSQAAANELVTRLEQDRADLETQVADAAAQAGPARDLRRRRERALAVLRRRASAAGNELAGALTAAADLLRSDQDQAALGAELVDHLRAGRNRIYNTRRGEFNRQYVDPESPGVRAYERLQARIRAWAQARPRLR